MTRKLQLRAFLSGMAVVMAPVSAVAMISLVAPAQPAAAAASTIQPTPYKVGQPHKPVYTSDGHGGTFETTFSSRQTFTPAPGTLTVSDVSGGVPSGAGCTSVTATVTKWHNYWLFRVKVYDFHLRANWCVDGRDSIISHSKYAWYSGYAGGTTSVHWMNDWWNPLPGRAAHSRLTIEAHGDFCQGWKGIVCLGFSHAWIRFSENGNRTWFWDGRAG